MKNRLDFVIVGYEKFRKMEPSMTMICSTGRPALLKVNRRITRTNRMETTETTMLSRSKELFRSRSEVELPTVRILSASSG